MREDLIRIFPSTMIKLLDKYIVENKLQEIRVKIEKPVIINLFNEEIILDYKVTREDMKYILQRISNYSLYAYEEEIKQGFITLKGGHRVGIAGECVMDEGKIKTIRNIASLNIRICREIVGCSNKVMKYIYDGEKVYNTLIISPPKCGKTTILRDIARNISNFKKKIAIIDERSEIASSYLGVPQMDVGIRSDVLDNCLKSEGMMMAIRSLSPEVIICDEIGTNKDIDALQVAFNSGVNIIVTLHGANIHDFLKRNVFKDLIENNIVQRVIILGNSKGVGTVENIYDLTGREVKECLS